MSSDVTSRERAGLLGAILERTVPSTQTTERLSVAVTALSSSISVSFILLYWFQQHGYAVGTYQQFLAGGALLDRALGTQLFVHPSVWHPLAAALLAGIAVPLVGTFVVHRQQALIGETLAHAAFAGVAVGVVINGVSGVQIPLELTALVISIVGALGLEWLTRRSGAYGDVALATVLVGSFAVGTLLIEYSEGRFPVGIDIEQFLFGNPAIVTVEGTRIMLIATVVVFGVVALFYKQLLYITFDTPAARAAQIDSNGYNTLLIVLTALVVVGAMQVLGVILVAGLLVVPVATASQVAGSFRELLVLSVLFGQLSVLGGVFAALVLGLPSGGTIISLAICFYLLALVRSKRRPRSIPVQ